jgi:hypothetical protein
MAKKVAARTLDFSNVKEGSGISAKHMEDGEYLATITEVRDDPAKDGEAMWLFIIRLDVNRTATYGYYCKLVDNQLWKLRNLFIAAGVDVPKRAAKLDPNKLVNKNIGVILETEEYEGRERSTISGVIPKEELSDFAATEADDDDDDDDDEDDEPAPAPKKRGRPAKAKVVEEEDDDDDDDEEEEPAPKKRGRGRPKKVVEEEDDDDDDDDEPAPAPKRGRGRPKKVVEEEPDDDDDEDDEPEPPKRKRGRPAKAAAPAKKRRRAADDDDDDLELDL